MSGSAQKGGPGVSCLEIRTRDPPPALRRSVAVTPPGPERERGSPPFQGAGAGTAGGKGGRANGRRRWGKGGGLSGKGGGGGVRRRRREGIDDDDDIDDVDSGDREHSRRGKQARSQQRTERLPRVFCHFTDLLREARCKRGGGADIGRGARSTQRRRRHDKETKKEGALRGRDDDDDHDQDESRGNRNRELRVCVRGQIISPSTPTLRQVNPPKLPKRTPSLKRSSIFPRGGPFHRGTTNLQRKT